MNLGSRAVIVALIAFSATGCDGGAPETFAVDIRVEDARGRAVPGASVVARIPLILVPNAPLPYGTSILISPNPFEGLATVPFALYQPPARVRVDVRDLEGRVEAQLVDSTYVTGGVHYLQLDAAALPHAGVFSLRLDAGDQEGRWNILHLLPSSSGAAQEEFYEVALGQTDARGRITVTNRALFPSLFDARVVRVSSQILIDTREVGDAVTFVAGDGGAESYVTATIVDSRIQTVAIRLGS